MTTADYAVIVTVAFLGLALFVMLKKGARAR